MGVKFKDKKLLVLGSSTGSVDIVEYARTNGAYVVVADNLNPNDSPAKLIANESLMISTSDVDALVDFVFANHIDGVFAGISGFNILKAMEVSERCGLRFYCNLQQWRNMEVKDGFRDLCKEYSVPSPQTYYIGGQFNDLDRRNLAFPVVIKPVDSGASRGVYICADEKELALRFPEAVGQSPSAKVIVESYEAGDEFTAHYVVKSGKAQLVCIDDRYPISLHEGRVTTIPIARVYPSRFARDYIKHVNDRVVNLIESLQLDAAVCFVQGLYDTNTEKFSLFEAGMRSAAELPNRLIRHLSGNDYMHFLVDMLLIGESDYDALLDDPEFGGKTCAIVSLAATGGVVGVIAGLEQACSSLESVIAYESRYPVGAETPDGDTLSQLMIRYVMVNNSKEELARDIAYLNSHVVVLDNQGNDMTVRFDPERLHV